MIKPKFISTIILLFTIHYLVFYSFTPLIFAQLETSINTEVQSDSISTETNTSLEEINSTTEPNIENSNNSDNQSQETTTPMPNSEADTEISSTTEIASSPSPEPTTIPTSTPSIIPTPTISPTPMPILTNPSPSQNATASASPIPIVCASFDLLECQKAAEIIIEGSDPDGSNKTDKNDQENNTNNENLDNKQTSQNLSDQDKQIEDNKQTQTQIQIANQSSSNTGNNILISNSENNLITGSSYAVSDLFNLINTVLSGSFIGFNQILLTNTTDSTVDLNHLWKYALTQGKNLSDMDYLLTDGILVLDYQTIVNQLVTAYSNSGDNQLQANDNNYTNTGDSGASANAVSLVNTLLQNSTVLFSSVNVVADNTGLIILPRPENFDQSLATNNNLIDISNNQMLAAKLNTYASANTGNNTQSGLYQILNTGNATALANMLLWGNIFFDQDSVFITFINSNSNWQGSIFDFPSPSTPSNNDLAVENNQNDDNLENQTDNTQTNPLIVNNQNSAELISTVSASANSGNNSQNTNNTNQLTTGDAVAFANFFGLLNGYIKNSNIFISFINILSPWKGNVAFAYPDLEIQSSINKSDLQPGDSFVFKVTCSNNGTDKSNNTKVIIHTNHGLRLNLQDNISYLGNNTYQWLIGNLDYGKIAQINISGVVDPQFNFKTALRNNDSIFTKNVYAADLIWEDNVITQFSASSSDPEKNLNNNDVSVNTKIYQNQNTSNNNSNNDPDNRLPKLVANIQNNVNQFVYPADTVTFTAFIKNEGEVIARSSYAILTVYNSLDRQLFSSRFSLGDIDPDYEGRLTFGVTIPNNIFIKDNLLYTKFTVYGQAPNESWVASNDIFTQFLVKIKNKTNSSTSWHTVNQILQDVPKGQVLAIQNNTEPVKFNPISPLIYIFPLLLVLLILKRMRRILFDKNKS